MQDRGWHQCAGIQTREQFGEICSLSTYCNAVRQSSRQRNEKVPRPTLCVSDPHTPKVVAHPTRSSGADGGSSLARSCGRGRCTDLLGGAAQRQLADCRLALGGALCVG